MAQIDWPNLLINGTTLVAALSASYFSHKSLLAQRKQKLADFRQEWIENLRLSVSDFAAASYQKRVAQTSLGKAKSSSEKEKWGELFHKQGEEVSRQMEYIRLCLDPTKESHAHFENILLGYSEQDSESDVKQLVNSARRILDAELQQIKHDLI